MLPVDSSNAVEKEWSETVIIFSVITIFNSERTDDIIFHYKDTGVIIMTK